jgi:prolyl-tRNA editing enzyme YbaK/EbsC (Cys-tRNA(Pro) deacylase)
MIENIVRYLHAARIPFRLASYPSEERLPKAAHAIPAGGMLVETQILLLDGRSVLACFPAGEAPDLAAVGAALGGLAVVGTTDELPDDLRYAEPPIPPLGQLFGLPLVLDERVSRCSVLVFASFGESDFLRDPV